MLAGELPCPLKLRPESRNGGRGQRGRIVEGAHPCPLNLPLDSRNGGRGHCGRMLAGEPPSPEWREGYRQARAGTCPTADW